MNIKDEKTKENWLAFWLALTQKDKNGKMYSVDKARRVMGV